MIDYNREEVKPFFVYGSLLSGLQNNDLIAYDTASTRDGLVSGYDLYANGFSFPFAVEGEGDVRGEIVTITDDPGVFPLVLRSLDRLEGYTGDGNDLYTRRVVQVVADNGDVVEAYMYVAHESMNIGMASDEYNLPYVPRGNWREWMNNAPKNSNSLFMHQVRESEPAPF